jgi:hypothetical protein
MENFKEKYIVFATTLLFDVVDNYRDIEESDENEVWKLGYREATEFVLRRMQELDDFVFIQLIEILNQQSKSKTENQ